MTVYFDVFDEKMVEVDACIQQLSSKDKRAIFSNDKTEMLANLVLKWVLNVSSQNALSARF